MPEFFTPIYIASQFAALIACSAALAAYHLKDKTQIFAINAVANVFDIIHYGLLGGISGAAVKLVAILRNIFMTQQPKHEILKHVGFMVGFIVVYVIIGIFTFQSWFSVLPLVSAVIYMIVSWYCEPVKIKLAACLLYIPWLVYNIHLVSVIGTLASLIGIFSALVAYRNEVKEKRAEENKIWIAGLNEPVEDPENEDN